MGAQLDLLKQDVSHPTRGAWIEIVREESFDEVAKVAPHTGCVD